MKEADYILAKNLTTIRIAQQVTDGIFPGKHIPEHELRRVRRLLDLWNVRTYVAMGDSTEQDRKRLAQMERDFAEDKGTP